jgi:MFS family permease
MGVFRLLFNFYVLSLGYNEALLGSLITVSSLTALLAALPMGYLADFMGRKNSLLISGALMSASIMVIVLWPSQGVLYAMNVVSGLGQSLAAVTMAPFLMENSGEKERTYLFSFGDAANTASAALRALSIRPAVLCLQTSGLIREIDPAYAGHIYRCGLDHAFHERIFPPSASSARSGDWLAIRLGVVGDGSWVVARPSPC